MLQRREFTIEQVPFKGSSEALAALLGGHVKIMFSNIASVKEQVKAGKLRVLAIADPHRCEDVDLKNVPTFKEQGVDLIFNNWQGIGAPKGIPEDIQINWQKESKIFSAIQSFKRIWISWG